MSLLRTIGTRLRSMHRTLGRARSAWAVSVFGLGLVAGSAGLASGRVRPVGLALSPSVVTSSEEIRLKTKLPPSVSVTPANGVGGDKFADSAYSAQFTVKNNTSSTDTYTLSCYGSQITCTSLSQTWVTLSPNQSKVVTAYYRTNVGASGNGYVGLIASGNTEGWGTWNITIWPKVQHAVSVAPTNGTQTPDRDPNTAGYTAAFTIKNVGTSANNFDLVCQPSTTITCTAQSRTTTGTLTPFQSVDDTVTYSTGESGTGKYVQVRATRQGGTEQATGQWSFTVRSLRLPPQVSLAPHNAGYRDASLCALDCFDVTAAYTTPAYVSHDSPRSVTLVYSSARARVRPTVLLDVIDPSDSVNKAAKISVKLKHAGSFVEFRPGQTELFFQRNPGWRRLAFQFEDTLIATGAYADTIKVTSHWNDGAQDSIKVPVSLLVVNERTSPLSAGWSIAGLQRLYPLRDGSNADTAFVITEGNGSISRHLRAYLSPAVVPPGDYSAISKRPSWPDGIKYDRKYPDSSKVAFDTAGRAAYAEDRFGNRTTYHGTLTRLDSITDPAGHVIRFGYDGAGKLAWIEEHNRRTNFTVDANSNLTQIEDADGVVSLGALYTGHRIMKQWNARRDTTRFVYDHTGKADSIIAPPFLTASGSTVRLATRFRSPERGVVPDPAGTSGTSSNPAPTDTVSKITGVVIAANGDSTKLAVDHFGAPTRTELSDGKVYRTDRDSASRVTYVVGPEGALAEYSWNTWGNLTRSYNFKTSAEELYAYQSTYQLLSTVSGNTVAQWYYYGSLGRLDSSRVGTSASPVTKYWSDARGRVDSIVDPLGHRTRYFRDGTGWKNTDSVSQGTRRVRFRYGSFGRMVATVGPFNLKDSVVYDTLNRAVQAINPFGYVVSSVFGDSVNVTQVTDPKGQAYKFRYNALGLTLDKTDPANQADTLKYNPEGLIATWKNRRGDTTTLTYDARGRIKTKRLSDGRTTTFGYDSAGTIGSITVAANGESTDTIRVQGDTVEATTVRGGARYKAWSLTNRWTTVTTTIKFEKVGDTTWTRTAQYDRNAREQVNFITPNGLGATALTYDNDGLLTGITIPTTPNWVETWQNRPSHVAAKTSSQGFVHDTLLRVVEKRNVANDSLTLYGYDGLGQITTVHKEYAPHNEGDPSPCPDVTPSHEYGLDCGAYSLLIPGTQVTFSYDSAGNPFGTTVDPGNRLRTYRGYSIEYDADGNMKRKYLTANPSQWEDSLFWNSENVLDSVKTRRSAGVWQTVRFGYDGFGRRVRKSSLSATIWYVYLGDQIIAEIDSASNTLRQTYTYYPGIDRPHSVRKADGSIYYYSASPEGNVVTIKNASNNAVATYRYTPFGRSEYTWESGAVSNPYRFAGREFDTETGLYYNRARYYDPEIERFISEDPIGLAGGMNVYTYAGSDPINASDPYGLSGSGCLSWAMRLLGSGPSDRYVITCSYFRMATITVWGDGSPDAWPAWDHPQGEPDRGRGRGRLRRPGAGGFSNAGGLTASQAQAVLLETGALVGAAQPLLEFLASVELAFFNVGTGVARSTITVLGHYPEYLQLAHQTGANAFTVGKLFGNAFPRVTWALNAAYVRGRVFLGDSFRIILDPHKDVAGWLKREIDLIERLGYRCSSSWCVP